MKKGWELKKLGNVMEIARGGSPRPIKKYITESEDGLNWIKISDATASSKYIYETKQKISKDGLHKTRLVEEGDFLLSNSMSFGRPYIMKTRGCIHDGWLVLKEKEDNLLNKDYLYYLLGSPYIFKEFDRLAAGSTVRNLNIALVSSVQIPIPPIEEQQQIVAILDDAFAAIEQAQANIEKNIENAKELFQSKLNDIFSQKGEGWRREVVKDVLILKSGKTVSKDIEKDIGEVIYTKVGDMNLAGNEVDIVSSSRYVNFKDINESQIIPKGSVIFPKRGGAIATNKKRRIVKPTIVDLNTMALIPSKDITSDYLYFWFKTVDLNELSNGANVPQINNYSFDDTFINFPKLIEEQEQIVAKLDKILDYDEELIIKYQQKLTNLEDLKKSLLEQAFAGKLTCNEPNPTH